MQIADEMIREPGSEESIRSQAALRSPLADLRGHDVVIVSPQYWADYWVSKHWIAYEFSRELRTVFIEPPLWVGGMLRRPWTGSAHFRRTLRPLRTLDHKLHILSPKLLPPRVEQWAGCANQRAVEALHQIGITKPIVLNFSTNFDLVKRLDGAVSVYYCVDPPFLEPGHENDEALTCDVSDLVYAVSETYRLHLAPLCTKQAVHTIPHGYAFEHARRIQEDPDAGCPADLSKLRRPVLGFVGSIHDANLDIELLERLAAARPRYSVVLIGPYRNNPLGPDLSSGGLRRLRRLRNVHLLGPRHFLDVPRYVKQFDVCLVLTNVRDRHSAAMTDRRTHFKWLAYLTMGKPIVAPNVRETEAIADLIYLARDDESYISAIDEALAEDGALRPLRVRYASEFSFDKTLDAIARPIAQLLGRACDPMKADTRSGEHFVRLTPSGPGAGEAVP